MSLREAFKKTCSGNEKCPYWALLPYWALFTYIATYWAAKNVLKQKQVSSNTTSTLQQCPVIWPLLYSSGNYPKLCNPAAIVIRVVTRAAVSDTASLQTGTVGHSRWGGDTEGWALSPTKLQFLASLHWSYFLHRTLLFEELRNSLLFASHTYELKTRTKSIKDIWYWYLFQKWPRILKIRCMG